MSDPMQPGPITEGLALNMARALELKAMPEILVQILGLKATATPYEIIEAVREQAANLEDATAEIVHLADSVERSTGVPQGDELAGNYIRRAVGHVVGPVGPNTRALALADEIKAAVRKTAAGMEVGQDLKGLVFSAFNAAKRWAGDAGEDDTKALKALRLITQDEWQRVTDRATKAEAKAGETKDILLREIAHHAGAAATGRAELRLMEARANPAAPSKALDGKSFAIGGMLGALLGALTPPPPEAPKAPKGVRR